MSLTAAGGAITVLEAANRSPVITSGPTATPSTINDSETSALTVTAFDPDGDALTYNWSATGGSISGSGASVTYNPPDVSTSTDYTITVIVDDRKGGTDSGSVNITVNPLVSGTAHLSVGSGSGYPGDSGISIAVNLSSNPSGDVVAGLNLDLNYDSAALSLTDVTIGQAASSAGKSLSYSEPAAGMARIIIFGLNQDTIADGVIADVSFDILASASSGDKALTLTNYSAIDPNVLSVSLTAVGGAITVLDNIPPTGGIFIDAGAEYTNSLDVILTITASDESGVAEMMFSNDNIIYSAAESYSTTKSWVFSSGDGTKTVYVKFRDYDGNWNDTGFSDTIILDSIVPSIIITSHQDNQSVSSQPITLEGKVQDAGSGAKYVKVNNNSVTLTGENFQLSLNLSEGANSIVVEAEDDAGNIATAFLALNYTAASQEETEPATVPVYYSPPIFISGGTTTTEEVRESAEITVPVRAKRKPVERMRDIKRKAVPEMEFSPAFREQKPPEPYKTEPYREEKPKITIAEEREEIIPEIEEIPLILEEKEELKPEAVIKPLIVKAKLIRRFLIWKTYQLELEGDIRPIHWQLAENQKLPFGLRLNKNKGIISGMAWGKKEYDLNLNIITQDRRKIEASCKLGVK